MTAGIIPGDLKPIDRFAWERVILRARLPVATRFVALVMATYGNSDGTRIRPGFPLLARVTGMGESTVRRHVDHLLKVGLIERLVNGGGPNKLAAIYRLTLPTDLIGREGLSLLEEDQATPLAMRSGVQSYNSARYAERSSPNPAENSARSTDNSAQSGGELRSFQGATPLTQMSAHQETKDQTPPSPTAQALAVVVVEALPTELREQMTLAKVAQSCIRLATNGWTAAELRRATTARNWTGTQGGGAVISWLAGLGDAPRPDTGGSVPRAGHIDRAAPRNVPPPARDPFAEAIAQNGAT